VSSSENRTKKSYGAKKSNRGYFRIYKILRSRYYFLSLFFKIQFITGNTIVLISICWKNISIFKLICNQISIILFALKEYCIVM